MLWQSRIDGRGRVFRPSWEIDERGQNAAWGRFFAPIKTRAPTVENRVACSLYPTQVLAAIEFGYAFTPDLNPAPCHA